MSAAWHEALRRYRRRSLESKPADEPSRKLFVLCAESWASAALAAAFEPALVLSTLGVIERIADPAVYAAFEYGIRQVGIRDVVLFGHHGCRAHPEASTREAGVAEVGARASALLHDQMLRELLRGNSVSVRAIWLDEPEGDIYTSGIEGPRPVLLADDDVARLLGSPSHAPVVTRQRIAG